ncbi:class I SAM-dependent methyltransferase [Novosphingobium aerophilum]|uniref:Methyltransferase domain-containing protein n=1 Tax=Novosphingobium aerophilum TaxID=2839843 RepID=A0A7X1F711_9SPHN|nr:class I SAM-dependent methyltransferase [Novosphingobium aerophilum]MBC2651540.1 methyltransferase domain-containing protein [Novosphingobium aerophilum]
MNLFDMLRRKDRNLEVSGPVAMAKHTCAGQLWRGLSLAPSAALRIPDVRRFASLRTWPADCGWMIQAPVETVVEVSFRAPEHDDRVVELTTFHGGFQPLVLPWPKARAGKLDLHIKVIGQSPEAAFLAVHRALSRQWLFDSSTGRGVEIGPGAQPQILPREGVEVSYLEQMPPDVWNALYNGGGKYVSRPELWDNYIVGNAQDLPVPDGSLDFLFGSHVFEHLANPIGHLRNWKAKMRPGGKVICVVPDLNGTKDAIQQRSSLAEWLEEDAACTWAPVLHHYMRHLRRPADDEELIAAMSRNESIHVHYYDNINCQVLLDYAVTALGYSDYLIEHTPNHKDFHFMLFN